MGIETRLDFSWDSSFVSSCPLNQIWSQKVALILGSDKNTDKKTIFISKGLDKSFDDQTSFYQVKNIFDQKVVTFEISTRQVKQIEIAVTEPQETTIVIESSVACDDPILHYLTNGNVVCHPSAEDRQAAKPAVTPAVEEHLTKIAGKAWFQYSTEPCGDYCHDQCGYGNIDCMIQCTISCTEAEVTKTMRH
jgi:hypothetical protein